LVTAYSDEPALWAGRTVVVVTPLPAESPQVVHLDVNG
jgi:hypothetical protein